MADIRITLGVAVVFGTAVAAMPASAQPCAGRDASCSGARPGAPLALDQFLGSRPSPAQAASSHHKRHAKTTTAKTEAVKTETAKSEPELGAPSEPAAKAAEEQSASEPSPVTAAVPSAVGETDGIAVTSPDQWNTLDAEADDVKVVSANELNEIDLAAPPAAVESQPKDGLQAMAQAEEPGDSRWIGKLLTAMGITLAAVAAVRLVVPRQRTRDA
ncbi:MAG TPA: hypothetical protein VFA53_08550 [Xanthobacteraceae bacterium]|nr:hypothetical protein [Xanthobacteraceae bacterium]